MHVPYTSIRTLYFNDLQTFILTQQTFTCQALGTEMDMKRGKDTQLCKQIIATQCDGEWRLKNTRGAVGTHRRDTRGAGLGRGLTPFV